MEPSGNRSIRFGSPPQRGRTSQCRNDTGHNLRYSFAGNRCTAKCRWRWSKPIDFLLAQWRSGGTQACVKCYPLSPGRALPKRSKSGVRTSSLKPFSREWRSSSTSYLLTLLPAVWKLLLNVSQWVPHTVEKQYRLQFGSRPPRFYWVLYGSLW